MLDLAWKRLSDYNWKKYFKPNFTNNSIKKWAEDLNKHLFKEDI